MQSVSRTEDIEAGCDLPFERKWWRVQRVSWLVLCLLLLGGIAGFFGNGLFSKTTAHSPGGEVQVRYAYLARRETPNNVELHLQKPVLGSGQVHVQLNGVLVDRLQLKSITPKPLAAEPLADGVRFTFPTDPQSDTATILLSESPTEPGFVEGVVTVDGAEPVRLPMFVYP